METREQRDLLTDIAKAASRVAMEAVVSMWNRSIFNQCMSKPLNMCSLFIRNQFTRTHSRTIRNQFTRTKSRTTAQVAPRVDSWAVAEAAVLTRTARVQLPAPATAMATGEYNRTSYKGTVHGVGMFTILGGQVPGDQAICDPKTLCKVVDQTTVAQETMDEQVSVTTTTIMSSWECLNWLSTVQESN